MRAPGWLIERPIAHRGLHDRARGIVENTCGAAEAAIAAGYAVEVDLRVSADGEAMVFHDATLERLTEATGPVASRPARELQRLAFRDTSERMSTLGELLEHVADRAVLVLEVKSEWDDVGPLERRVAALLAAYRGRAAAMSFDPRSVSALRTLAPALVRGLVAERFAGPGNRPGLTRLQRFRMRHLLTAFTVAPHFIAYDVRALPTLATQTARALGLPVLTWTVRSEGERAVAERWADQMIFEGWRPETTASSSRN